MSPLSLRRDRAERLLRHEFESLRGRVLESVRGRLRVSGVSLDRADLEGCYGLAWQGLYLTVLEGQQVANPTGWLVQVTFRRAIDEHLARTRARCAGELGLDEVHGAGGAGTPAGGRASVPERDFAAELDDRARLRQLFEALAGRLDGRERDAAALCYLQGLSRSQAAARMGVSEPRMRKLMDGLGPGRPGVAAKVGGLVETIRAGAWCEEQGSLMRALAFGVLDPEGERYKLALIHRGECPACRAYVVSLRGLAATLPPVFLRWGLGAGVFAHANEVAHGGAAGHAGARAHGAAAHGGASGYSGAGASLQAGRGLGGALSGSSAAGVGGAAGGGWLVGAGPLGAKLAAGCLLALSVGAGCIALGVGHHATGRGARHAARQPDLAARAAASFAHSLGGAVVSAAGPTLTANALAPAAALTPTTRASREFGPEQALGPSAGAAASAFASAARRSPRARAASTASARSGVAQSSSGGSERVPASSQAVPVERTQSGEGSQPAPGDSAAAEREFSPG